MNGSFREQSSGQALAGGAGSPPCYRRVAGGAGLRWGEAAGLRADAVDLDGHGAVIRTVVEVAGRRH